MVYYTCIYIEGSQVKICKKILYLTNSVDADYAAFDLGLHCLSKYPFKGFGSTKG